MPQTTDIRKSNDRAQNILFLLHMPTGLGFRANQQRGAPTRQSGGTPWDANFGIAGLDWQQRVNWDRLREYRIERARTMMKKHGLGAMLCMYDENVPLHHRHADAGLEPAQARPALRHAVRRRPADSVRAGRHRLPDRAAFAVDPEGERASLLRLDQRRGRSGLDPAGDQVHQGGHPGDEGQRRRRPEARLSTSSTST